ncbi:MAG: PaaI family thioesterase [Bdellovibrionales bacterium]|nr:PaaI family thioesterase [Bdellovibrionales bacterium]
MVNTDANSFPIPKMPLGLSSFLAPIWNLLPVSFRETLMVRIFGAALIPVLNYVRPRVLELSPQRCRVLIPLTRRTKNHLRSMYFAVLAAGADCAGGLLAMRLIQTYDPGISLVFKDFKADFLKRPEGDVEFRCDQGAEILAFFEKVRASDQRLNLPVKITASVPSVGPEPVAEFILTLSLKKHRVKG